MPADRARSIRRASRRFARLFSGTLAILALLAAGLAAANFTQGPRLASAEINLEGSVVRSGPRLLLTANQPLAVVAASQVTVQPKTDVTATVAGAAITIQFSGILRYNTLYTVKVNEVTGASQDAAATLEYRFTTPDIRMYALQRDKRLDSNGTKLPDTIRQTSLRGHGDGDVVFSSQRIQQYAALDSHLAVATLNDDDTSALVIAPLDDGKAVQVPLPASGAVGNLHASASKHVIGYTFTSSPHADGRKYQDTPFTYDLTDTSGMPREITGFDGHPMSASNLAFVPDTTSLVVQAYNESLFLLDVLGGKTLTPLGVHAEMRGFVPGTRALIVADPTHGSTINLANGAVTTLKLATSVLSDRAYPGKFILLDEHGRYAQLFQQETTDPSRLASAITVTDAAGSRIAFKPASHTARVSDFCVSPNGQYLAVETVSDEGVPDSYPNLPAFSGTTIVLLDLVTDTSTRSVTGFLPDWCR